MDTFDREVLRRLPLAEAVCLLLRYVCDESLLRGLFERHRGTGWEGEISFPLLVSLISDALLHHQGSGRRSFAHARHNGQLNATDAAVYGKLRRLPLNLSQAFLAECTGRLCEVLREVRHDTVPPALSGYVAIVIDGKKLKRLAKRLKLLRSQRGKALGGKVLAGLALHEGLIVAQEASPDGEANDAPLTPGLMEQLENRFPNQRLLVILDRQFCDLKIPRRITAGGHAFLIRFSKKMLFFPEREQVSQDAQGRTVRQACGYLGRPQDARRMYVRQITLERPGEEDVIVVTNLLDADEVPAEQLLEAYSQRWTIERVFQQVTEVFHLRQLISSSPQGAIFQFALCALLYNVIQVIRRYIADVQQRTAESLSSEMIFGDVCKQLTAALLFIDDEELTRGLNVLRGPQEMGQRLRSLLHGQWSPLWIKSPPKKKTSPIPKQSVRGGHFSAWKILHRAHARSP